MAASNSTMFNSSSSGSGSQALTTFSPIDSDSTFSPPHTTGMSLTFEPLSKSFPVISCKSESDILDLVVRTLEDCDSKVDKAARYYFTDIPAAWGPSIFACLDDEKLLPRKYRKSWNSRDHVLCLKLPNLIHNSIQRWFANCASEWERSGLITPNEKDMIDGTFGTTLTLTNSPFTKTLKEPDILVDPDDQHLPSVVFESGWSEPLNALEADCELLLRGSGGLVQVAIIVNWTLNHTHQTVSGDASVWQLNDSDQPIRRQTEDSLSHVANFGEDH
ncbi:hypothetical protein N7489_011745 [Penicillium chrysogenum]|uniref:Uncharacterized protein n=1 Tax=Penicillium chrysogenum TaxID=5076 RepID=A0ABQ8W108_PENCH|nr:uncharacterized protein N7489_011745 [Penicillium chrysogenum]KAJ5231037.1 hypothetical protein N7489_011745 [Penicillium chrysogenum]KAJ5253365.1 hypothetical protein N7505_012028 [Penicillium chrysogenum]KAJ5268421.1 hypothetical protein N7524_005880 [Penicillium chrysogenum]KAJ6162816.1 hypothetical protein N7497_002795 [Penicillium chrysogenum]